MDLVSHNVLGLKDKPKGKSKQDDAKPTDNVRCPFGCKTVGYDSTTRYHEHLRKTHNFTKQSMEPITELVRKNGHLSLGEKWKKTYPTVVSQKKTGPQGTVVPPPYTHSADEYKSASRNPHQGILERIKSGIRHGNIREPIEWWSSLSNDEMDAYLRDVWLPLVPAFLDSVDEEGIYQSRPYVSPTEQYANMFDEDNSNPGVWPVPN